MSNTLVRLMAAGSNLCADDIRIHGELCGRPTKFVRGKAIRRQRAENQKAKGKSKNRKGNVSRNFHLL